MSKRGNGNTLVEYGFIAALILIVCIGVLYSLGGNINGAMKALKSDLTKNTTAAKGG